MNGPAGTYRLARGAQALALLLAVAVGLQGIPVHSLVHHAQSTHHECTHPKGYCPMNPDGPCRCDHDDHASEHPEMPTFESCDGLGTKILNTTGLMKWRPIRSVATLSPRQSTISRTPVYTTRTSQRRGRDIFRPPRDQANARPALTQQVVGFA